MTTAELEAIVEDCVAEWFGRMQNTGEIPRDKPDAVAEAQKETETRVFTTLQKNAPVFEQLLESDQKVARDAVNAFIDAVSAY